jgi:hypothetical protein
MDKYIKLETFGPRTPTDKLTEKTESPTRDEISQKEF